MVCTIKQQQFSYIDFPILNQRDMCNLQYRLKYLEDQTHPYISHWHDCVLRCGVTHIVSIFPLWCTYFGSEINYPDGSDFTQGYPLSHHYSLGQSIKLDRSMGFVISPHFRGQSAILDASITTQPAGFLAKGP